MATSTSRNRSSWSPDAPVAPTVTATVGTCLQMAIRGVRHKKKMDVSVAPVTGTPRRDEHDDNTNSNTNSENVDFYDEYDNNKDFFDDENNVKGREQERQQAPPSSQPQRQQRGGGRSDRSYDSNSDGTAHNGHDYVRGYHDHDTNVNVAAVDALLAERLRARKTGDFDTADQLRDRLATEHSVTVYDKDKLWEVTMQAQQPGRGGAGGYRRPSPGRGRGGGREGGGRGGRGIGDRAQRKRSNFGPNGHDYELSREAGPSVVTLPESEIHRQIAERLMAKMTRDFVTADRVQLSLSEEGVYIDDRTKTWRADGVRFIDPSEGRRSFRDDVRRNGRDSQHPQQPTNINRDQNRPYVQSEFSTPFLKQHEDGRFDTIQTLVSARAAMKKERNYAEADAARDTLHTEFDVLVDDRIREWSMGGSFGTRNDLKRAHDDAIKSRGYIRSQFSEDLADDHKDKDITIDDIQAKVNQRTGAKMDRRYAESDQLRDELRDTFNVVIHDKIKMWSIGGNFGTDDPHKAKEIAMRTYVRKGGGDLTETQLIDINDTLSKRVDAKKVRDFVKSDELRTYLYETYNINISDPDREWRVLPPETNTAEFFQAAPGPGATRLLTNDEVTMVESMLAERTAFKKQRSFDLADAIRDDLERTYSVMIDDKSKEWKVVRSRNSDNEESRYSNNDRKRSSNSNSGTTNIRQSFGTTSGERNDIDSNNTSEAPTSESEPKLAAVVADSETLDSLSRNELMALTVVVLKEKLREVGKPVSGKKSELIDRLVS